MSDIPTKITVKIVCLEMKTDSSYIIFTLRRVVLCKTDCTVHVWERGYRASLACCATYHNLLLPAT